MWPHERRKGNVPVIKGVSASGASDLKIIKVFVAFIINLSSGHIKCLNLVVASREF